ncbi:hypothetical protein Tco_1377001 [Tanacetum coccineum]
MRDALPSPIHETEIPEICLPLRKRRVVTNLSPGIRGSGMSSTVGAVTRLGTYHSFRADLYSLLITLKRSAPRSRMSRELGYGITDTWDDLVGAIQEIAPTTLEGAFHRRTALLMEEEARLSRAAWAQSMDACNQTRSEGISLRTTVMAQQSEITELQAADCRRQAIQMAELQRQQGPAKDPAEPELPEEASSSS